MKGNVLTAALVTGCLALLCPASASAAEILSGTVDGNCTGYTVRVAGDQLETGKSYAVRWWLGLQNPDGSISNYNAEIKVHPNQGSFDQRRRYAWNPPLGSGSYTFDWGHAKLYEIHPAHVLNTVYLNFDPAGFSCNGSCQCDSRQPATFNRTQIAAGDYIWFNSNFSASGIPADGTVVYFTNSRISFTAGGTKYSLRVPDAQVTFTTSVTCASTVFDTLTNTWFTTVPVSGDAEILMQDLAWPVPTGFGAVTGKVNWSTTMSTSASGVAVKWKWGAAVYSEFTSRYDELMAKPVQNSSCAWANTDQAGTPEGDNPAGEPWKDFLAAGGRGSGGTNYTGGWSRTASATLTCPRDR